MARLTAKQRKALPDSDFALPGRRYPIEDAGHRQAALSDVSRVGTPAQKKQVRAAVGGSLGGRVGTTLAERMARAKR
jgi:hypothetical protein